MLKKFLICVSVIVFIFTQVSFFYIPVSAEMPKYSTPDLDDYPDNIDGALSFVSDCFTSVGLNTVSDLCNVCIYPLDNTLGSLMENKFGCNPFDIPSSTFYDCFSDWYLNHANHSGGGGYRDGSVVDTDGSYSWNPPTNEYSVNLDDGAGGFFTVNSDAYYKSPYQETVIMQVYYRGNQIVDQYITANNSNWYTSSHANTPSIIYGVYSPEGSRSVTFYWQFYYGYYDLITPCDADYLSNNDWKFKCLNTKNNKIYTFSCQTYTFSLDSPSSHFYFNNTPTTFYAYNPTTNNIENSYYYGADSTGQPCVYDTDNNLINFNSDGTIGSNFYLIPDFSTLNDNDKIELTNLVTNYYMSVYFNLLRINNSDNSDVLPFLTSILNQLMGINDNTSDAETWLKSINSNVVRLDNDLNTWLRAINDTILSLDTGAGDNSDLIILLTELKKGLLGDSEPYKPDQIIDLLEQIAINTSPDPENLDEQPIDFQFDYYVQTVPDMLRERLDVSSYFKQLKNIFSMFFTDDFLSDIDFDEYFNTENYMVSDESSDSSEASVAASYSTADYPEVFGEELAEEDVDISSSVYLTASVYSSGATIEGSTIPAPYLEVHIMGHTYNLFEYLTPEVYDKIKPLKTLISLVLYAFYFLWVVRSVIPSLFTGSNLNFYNSTSEDL